MKRKPLFAFLVLIVLIVCGGVSWRFTRGSAGWQIRQAFPEAQPYFDPPNSPDLTISQVIRIAIPSHFSAEESLGFSLHDCQEPLDLTRRFGSLPQLKFLSVHFTRCKITNLCPTSSPGFPDIIVFDDCDFAQLPADQLSRLRPSDSTDPTAKKKFSIGEL